MFFWWFLNFPSTQGVIEQVCAESPLLIVVPWARGAAAVALFGVRW